MSSERIRILSQREEFQFTSTFVIMLIIYCIDYTYSISSVPNWVFQKPRVVCMKSTLYQV